MRAGSPAQGRGPPVSKGLASVTPSAYNCPSPLTGPQPSPLINSCSHASQAPTRLPFLTDIDSRAAIKGSRDPLSLVPVWSRFGRRVVGNLTTVTNSVRGFTTLLLGYYFAEHAQERSGGAEQSTLELFLKFEQLAAHVRLHVNGDQTFRGRDRVVLRHGQKGPKVTLGVDTEHQILGDQKIYGLWGLFSVASRSSGLLGRDRPVLTPVAREFVERHYIARLTADGFRGGTAIRDLLLRQNPTVHLDGRDKALAASLGAILAPVITEAERRFYREHLVHGGPDDRTHGHQPVVASLLADLPPDLEFDFGQLGEITRQAARLHGGEALADDLAAIGTLEALLVPMESAFGFMLSRDKQEIDDVASEVRNTWGPRLAHIDPDAIDALRPRLAESNHGEAAAERFAAISIAFASGAYRDALGLILEHNAFVMQARHGSQPWVRLDGSRLDVRYRDESGHLIPGEDLPHVWRNTYFLNSLKAVVTELDA